jgi:hypothetical protein
MENAIVKTSEEGWFTKLAEAYKNRTPIVIFDDAKVGIDPSNESLIQMGLKAKLSMEEWTGVGVSLGISAAGIGMIILGFVDPEPTSKLGLLIGGGVVCIIGGGFFAIRILTKQRPPKVVISPVGIEISWS